MPTPSEIRVALRAIDSLIAETSTLNVERIAGLRQLRATLVAAPLDASK
jgi:hypothetical protein